MNPARTLVAVAALLAGVSAPAQDLLVVAWGGATALVNSYTGAVTPLGTTLQSHNSLARAANGTFWSSRRITATSSWLTHINPGTGAATQMYFTSHDIRGLSVGPGTTLYGIKDAAAADLLMRIDTTTGSVVTIGSTGTSDIQGLALHQGVLYAWDVFLGLMVVDPATGAATDPFPGVGGPAYQQSLCSHPDGRLLLGGGDSNGQDQLFSVDPTTGVTSLIGNMVGIVDVRGIEPLNGFQVPQGQGCNGVHGQVVLSVAGTLQAGGSLLSTSTNHAPNVLGVMVLGFSTTSYNGQSLPLLLDPQFGTSTCRLYTSIDLSAIAFTGATTPATLQYGFPLPASIAGWRFSLQHACFEPVPGNMSWSNAVTVQLP